MAGRTGRRRRDINTWPGFVDALASLLMVVVFLVMVFVLAQFFLNEALSGRDQALSRLNRELAALAEILALEQTTSAGLREDLKALTAELRLATEARDDYAGQLEALTTAAAEAEGTVSLLREDFTRLTDSAAADQDRLQIQVSEIERLERNLVALQRSRDALEAALSESRQQKSDVETTLAEARRLLAARDQEAAALKERIEAVEAESSGRAGEIDRLNAALAASREEIVAQAETLAELNRMIAGLTAARAALEDDLAALGTRSEAQVAEAERLKAALGEARRALAQANDEAARLKTALAERTERAAADIVALEKALAAAEIESARLETVRAEDAKVAQDRIGVLERKRAEDADNARMRIAESERARAALESRTAAFAETLQEARTEAKRLREQLALARNRLAEAREELQLRRGVAEDGVAAAPDSVARALFEAAETRVMQLAVENTRLRDRLADLAAVEQEEEARLAALRRQIDDQILEIERLDALRRALNEARKTLEAEKAERIDQLAYMRTRAEKAEARVARLVANIEALKNQVKRLNAALEASEAKAEQAETLVVDARLNSALVRQIDELRRFRSEFVGQLREALAGQQLVQTDDDRFYLPTEVLFRSGSADLDQQGQERVRRIADALTDVAARIPEDLDWVLRVDGHTDRQQLRGGSRYRSNWELSVARAVAVVELLERAGVPAARLAATGFGEFHPLDPADSAEAFRRNRRIEFSLTRK
ncbi:MAG: OmpA family protein [Alphaproteobacteria bacterium]|nr:OmpA family protein [Alphaproteobacteria bacterium]